MHAFSTRAAWSLVGSLACLVAIANAAGVVEFDMVFPRANQTYAPTSYFPIVIAVQNTKLAERLKPSLGFFISNGSDMETGFGYTSTIRLTEYANMSDHEPYLFHSYRGPMAEGRYQLHTSVSWSSCDLRRVVTSNGWVDNSTSWNVGFTIKKGAQEVDLVSATAGLIDATADENTCSVQFGVAINVTDETRDAPSRQARDGNTCAVLASAAPTPTPNPCGVKVDSAAVASMSASVFASRCRGLNPPENCPKDSGAKQLAVAGLACFTVAFGAIGFILA